MKALAYLHRQEQMEAVRRDFEHLWPELLGAVLSMWPDERPATDAQLFAVKHAAWQAFRKGRRL